MNVAQLIASRLRDDATERRGLDFQDVFGQLTSFGGQPLIPSTTYPSQGEEDPSGFEQFAVRLLKRNPVVFSAASVRMSVFSQARFVWRQRSQGKVVSTFGDGRLSLLEKPWPGGTTSDLLARMELHNTVAGNAFVRRGNGRLHMMRPDWTSIILGSQLEPDDPGLAEDAEVLGYLYHPPAGQRRGRIYLPSEVAHFAPQPDPDTIYRGMSWISSIVDDAAADDATTRHKAMFFKNAATPNMVVKFDMALSREKVQAFKELMEDDHRGVWNAYKTLYLGGGADATVVGGDLQQADLNRVQGKGETRIAMASGVHPVVLGASEGLQGSSLNAGNYNAAKRAFSDIRLQNLWTNATASLAVLLGERRPGVELWFDRSDVPYLQDDLKDTAEIQGHQAQAIRSLTEAGYEPESVVQAIENDDLSLLKHTGVFSVQLQPPGTEQDPPTPGVEGSSDTGDDDE